MSRQIRRVALGLVVLFGALFVNLNVIQVLQADELRSDSRNARGLIAEYEVARGQIIAGEGTDSISIASSQDTGGRLRYQREYPEGARYAHVTGYHSFVYGRTEAEQAYNDVLTGTAPEVFARNVADLLAGRQRTGDTLHLTVDPSVQRAAQEGLEDRTGAVVALHPGTGAILGLHSSPSYDPGPLAAHDGEAVRSAWEELSSRETDPRLNRALRETYPPGSTFKLVTAAAALESGVQRDTTYPDPERLSLPLTNATIGNFGGGVCEDGEGISLETALEVSCNTTFGQIGLDLGGDRLVDQAERFGINAEPPLELPGVAVSRFPREDLDEPGAAQSAIGQRDVAVTPLQMAQVTAAVANGGELMVPQLVRRVEDSSGRGLRQLTAEPWQVDGSAQAVSAQTAATLGDMMISVVEDGTGQNAQIDGVEVGGKTGTAQTGEGRPPTVWFTGFAPAQNPQVAVAVVIADAGDDATGGAVAAPIAAQVMQAALDEG